MEDFVPRLKKFIDFKDLSYTQFGKKIGCSASQITQMITYKKNFGIDKLLKISKAFPELNMEWLLSGKGEMIHTLKGAEANMEVAPMMVEEPFPDPVKIDHNDLLIMKLKKEIRFLKSIHDTVKNQIKEKEEFIDLIKKSKARSKN